MQEHFREKYRLLGLRIAYYRKKCGYTQEQFAELIGKSWSFVSQIEANNGAKIKGISMYLRKSFSLRIKNNPLPAICRTSGVLVPPFGSRAGNARPCIGLAKYERTSLSER